jgi:predicted dehydrogenase
MSDHTRRGFLKSSAGAAASTLFAAPAILRAQNVNDRARLAVVGMGGRSQAHAESLIELERESGQNVELAAVCDCDEQKLSQAVRVYADRSGHSVAGFDDMRRLFDDPSIDCVTFSTPNHWHSLCAIWACQAGKDVYVEKPGSHNIFEGRKMVEAARKYQRIVQHGTQCRSSKNIIEGIRLLHQGIIGEVYLARGIAYKVRGALGQHVPSRVPDGLDWDQWTGPAPVSAFSNFRHRRWHWLWDYGNGEIGNQGVHQFDIIRWGLKRDTHPSLVQSMGTDYMQQEVHHSSTETPGLQTASMRWDDGKFATFEVRDWYTNAEAGFRDQYPFVQPDFPVGTIFLGSEGYMLFPDYSSFRTFLGPKREPGPSAFEADSPIMNTDHFRNFIAACRSRKSEDLHAEILEGHMSSALCHLANIAYRTGRTLKFDGPNERFVDDPEADALLTRPERAPYVVPREV